MLQPVAPDVHVVSLEVDVEGGRDPLHLLATLLAGCVCTPGDQVCALVLLLVVPLGDVVVRA